MTLNLGTVRPGSTILIPFNAFDSNDPSASVIISDFVLADIGIYKSTSMTERGSTTGVVLLDTDGINIDGATGVHGFSIDLSSNATAAFYSAGSHYYVTVGPITIDAATVNFVAATFTIGYPDAIINTTIASVTDQTQFILTDGPAEADVLIGCPILFHDVASAVQLSIGYITDYIVTTKEVFLAADPGGFTFVATDNVSIFMPANVRAVGGTLQTAGDIAALINALNDVAATDIVSAGAITTSSGAVVNVTNVTVNCADVTNLSNIPDIPANWITAAGVADGAIDAATFAAGAIDAAAIADAAIDNATFATDVGTTAFATNNIGLAANKAFDDAMVETTGAPAITGTFRAAWEWMFALSRNKIEQTATTTTLSNDAGSGIATSTVSDDATTYTRGEWST